MRKFLLFILATGMSSFAYSQDYVVQFKSGNYTPTVQALAQSGVNGNEIVNGHYYRYIQFSQIPNDEQKRQLAAKGVELYNYVPGYTYMASIPAHLSMQAIDDGNIRAAFSIAPAFKLSPELATKQYPQWALRSNNKIELMVSHHPHISMVQAEEWLAQQGAEILFALDDLDAHRVLIPVGDVDKLAALPYIYYMEPMDNDPQPDNLVGVTDHRSNSLATSYAGGLKYDGTGISVALNDDGVIGPHIDYTGRLINQYITYNNGNHGDHCAGTIFGAGNRNPTTRGMAFAARLGVYGVGNFASTYQAFDSINNHYNSQNIRITSTSYSNGNNSGYTTLARLMDIQITAMPDLMHVFSAGNAGTSDFNWGAGAGWANITGGHKQAKNVITVGNLTFEDALASSSSRGPARDGRIKPDICAVGSSVNSTIDPNTYALKTGTSMSCPGVAGVLAQLYHAYRAMNGNNYPPSALIKAAVLNTGDDLGNAGPDFRFGWGRINARRAYNLLQSNQYILDSVTNGTNKNHVINVPGNTAELRVMVYWADYRAAASANPALVNNLDMKVTTPSSAQVLPWVLNSTPTAAAVSAPATQGVDNLNNMEQVTIPNPAAGAYTVNVAGTVVPQGPQRYFVVYEFVSADGVVLTYPTGGESIVPGVQETIRWDAYGTSGTFSLQYSTNNGGNWTNISTNIAATQRHYNWTPPATVTGEALVRVTRGPSSDQSDAVFSVIGVPSNLTVDWVCVDSMKVSYSSVPNATGYVVSILGTTYMDSVGFSTTTSCVVKNINTLSPGWFSVHALGANNCKGRRANAVEYQGAPFNCSILDDLGIVQAYAPSATTNVICNSGPVSDTVSIEIRNNGLTALSNIAVGYSLNGGTPVTATYAGPLAQLSNVNYTFAQPISFTTTGINIVKVWAKHAQDMTPANDTITIVKNIASPAVKALPVSENFETFTACDTSANCDVEVCVLGADWINEKNGVDDDIDWRINAGPTPSRDQTSNTGPTMDYDPGTAVGQYTYLEANDCFAKTAGMVSPCIDLTTAVNPSLSFAYHMFGTGMGTLHVDVKGSNGQWNNDVRLPIAGNQGDSWKTEAVSLAAFKGQVINIRFRGETGGSNYRSDMALDAISIADNLSVNNVTGGMAMSVYPNPSEGVFFLNMSGVRSAIDVTVTDISGKVIRQQSLQPQSGSVSGSIELKDAAKGIYILTVKNEQGTINEKLIKL